MPDQNGWHVVNLAWSRSANALVTNDGTQLKVWDATGRLTATHSFPGSMSLGVNPVGDRIVTGDYRGLMIQNLSGEAEKPLRNLRFDVVQGLTWNGDDRIADWGWRHILSSRRLGDPQGTWTGLTAHDGRSATFGPDGLLLAGDPAKLTGAFVYAVERSDGRMELLTPLEFQNKAAAARASGAKTPLPLPPSLDPDRPMAFELVRRGAVVRIRAPAVIDQEVRTVAEIPGDLFAVEAIQFVPEKPFQDAFLKGLEPLGRLRTLQLSGAPVTDAGLEHVGRAGSLWNIFLDNTEITDAGLAHLQGLRHLRSLRLQGTKVTAAGMALVKNFHELEDLAWSDLAATDESLQQLAGLSKLRTIFVSGPGITDAGLQHLAGLKELRKLELTSTQITGTGLAVLKNFSHLEFLNVGHGGTTALSDEGVTHLPELPNLKNLSWDLAILLGDKATTVLTRVPNLESLWMGGTKVSDAGVENIARLSHLKFLTLAYTQVTDAGLPHIAKLTDLEVLYLQSLKQVTDASLPHLESLKKLKYVNLQATGVTAAGVARLKAALPACEVISDAK